jgi:hypothetical protein
MTELTNRQIEILDSGESSIVRCMCEILGIDEECLYKSDDATDRIHTIYDIIATFGEVALGIPEMETYPYVEDFTYQCASCERFFDEPTADHKECPFCHSGNWVYGCIDEDDPDLQDHMRSEPE